MQAYIHWVTSQPLLSASIQFAILGSLGEWIAFTAREKRLGLPAKVWQMLAKALAWALLGIIIKYGFAGCKGAVQSLMAHGMLPQLASGSFWAALTISVVTNLFFGPQMMFFHRLEDNFILQRWNYEGLQKAWMTLLWFWIPAHTLTFMLPKPFQIGLAALWSVALGLILGLSSRTSPTLDDVSAA